MQLFFFAGCVKGEDNLSELFQRMSMLFIPFILTVIIGHGALGGHDVYSYFIEGAKEGLKSAVDILPFLIAIFLGIQALVSSGALDFLEDLTQPFFSFFGIPEDLVSFILLRPVSGSGSLVALEEVLNTEGPDSYIGRAASVMMGSCETVFYVLAVYFGVTAVKKTRHTMLVGVLCYIIGVFAALQICKYM